MCLILQETLFQVQVLMPCKFIKTQLLTRQLAYIETCRAVLARGSTAARQVGICRDL